MAYKKGDASRGRISFLSFALKNECTLFVSLSLETEFFVIFHFHIPGSAFRFRP